MSGKDPGTCKAGYGCTYVGNGRLCTGEGDDGESREEEHEERHVEERNLAVSLESLVLK